MTTAVTTKPASEKQLNFIKDLAGKRTWSTVVTPEVKDTILGVFTNKLLEMKAASNAIDALLKIKPSIQQVVDLTEIPTSRYALPRKTDPTIWDFFEIVERKDGRKYLNRLLGAPGDWHRERLSIDLQAAAARAILADPKASAVAYATQHGRCSVCDAHLSDPVSIALGLGPICVKRFK